MTTPRWKTVIEKAIAQYKDQNVAQVATLDSGKSNGVLVPRVRSQVIRSFLEKPNTPSLPLLLSSTDIRTPKVTQLTTVSSKAEVVWWIDGTKQQFRFAADIYVVPEPKNPLYARFQEVLAKAERGTALSVFRSEDWEQRRVDSFRTMSDRMKAGWCRPVPGSKLEGSQEEAKKWPEKVVEPDEEAMSREEYEAAKRHWEMALGNFALVVIDPIDVDFVDLAEVPNRRWLFTKTLQEKDVLWEEEELVP